MSAARPLRVAMALPGLHRVNRGAEAALESLAEELAGRDEARATLFGSGPARPGRPYAYVHVPCTPRERFERWPTLPVFRGSYVYEEATFARRLWHAYRPEEFDVTLACSYPFTNWVLRKKRSGGKRVQHVYVTQNGDWPAYRRGLEYRLFSCDGLVCTTPEYFEAHKNRWRCALIPNGVDTGHYCPGPPAREKFGLPKGRRVVLMVSALVPSKRVMEGMAVVASMPDVHLLLLGDGPMRVEVDRFGHERLAGRFVRSTLSRDLMPALYRSVDALLHMSMDEPFGNVYIEAMACGLPLVAHERSTTRWITEGAAFLVDTTDAQAVRGAIAAAIGGEHAGMAQAGREVACRRFSWPKVADQYATFLGEIADGVSARSPVTRGPVHTSTRTPETETVNAPAGLTTSAVRQASAGALRVLFALPGLHRVNRGAEVAFESVAQALAGECGLDVTLVGSGPVRADRAYRFLHAGCRPRERFERWPNVPPWREAEAWEEMSFIPRLRKVYKPSQYDATITCSYPFTNWYLRRASDAAGVRPAHIFVTQNGDWPAFRKNAEFRWFACDGLICTNPDYFEHHKDRWNSVLIPNGVNPGFFSPGAGDRAGFGLPEGAMIALMVSALIPSKRVVEGIEAASRVPGLHLVVAGDGPLRERVDSMGQELMGPRFRRISIDRGRMPHLYRSVDALLHMSLDEPSSNAYIEALASGLPVVTHDRGVTRWTFENQAEFVDATRPELVAEAILRALAKRTPSHVAARRELVERRFTWSAIARQYAEFIQEVVDRRRASTSRRVSA